MLIFSICFFSLTLYPPSFSIYCSLGTGWPVGSSLAPLACSRTPSRSVRVTGLLSGRRGTDRWPGRVAARPLQRHLLLTCDLGSVQEDVTLQNIKKCMYCVEWICVSALFIIFLSAMFRTFRITEYTHECLTD